MNYTRFAKIYIIAAIFLVAAFSFAGAKKFRFFTALGAATWVATGPGVHHK